MRRSDLKVDDIGRLGQAITASSQQWRAAAREMGMEHSLGPRGPWILGLISTGQVSAPSDLSNFFRCSKSMITFELIKLADAGLVSRSASGEDGRKVELALTPPGEEMVQRIRDFLENLILDRLANYSRTELMLCVRLLNDFARRA